MMPRPPFRHLADGRSFRWPLRPLEAKLDGELEAARLTLGQLQHEERRAATQLQQCSLQHADQRVAATECLQRTPPLRPHVLGYLAELDAKLELAQAHASQLRQQVDAARGNCVERQRQLACLQRLRDGAERAHLQEQLRRAAREADAAWLARLQQLRASRPAGGA